MTTKVKKERPVITVRPLEKGYARVWLQCKKCKTIYYRDFVPFGLSSGITSLPCNHDIGHNSIYDVCRVRTELQVLKTHDIHIKGD